MQNLSRSGVIGFIFLLCQSVGAQVELKKPVLPPQVSTLERFAGATELPVTPWGIYALRHSAPCFLADRAQGQLFTFPIVVGQRRMDIVRVPVKTADGKTRMRPERMAVERRAMGLSPMQAERDDTADGANRQARISEANALGLYWQWQIPFAKMEDWGSSAAIVEMLPANAEPAAEGFLIRVTITNRSDTPQTYFVDLLGGIDTPNPAFTASDLNTAIDGETGSVLVRHKKSPVQFALVGSSHVYPQRTFRVTDAYFAPAGSVCRLDANGTAIPNGFITNEAANTPPDTQHPTSNWGLLRVNNITVAPLTSAAVTLCVGAGKDGEGAVESAQSLLAVSDSLYEKALKLHLTARYQSGSAAMNRLMALSLVNTPSVDLRRIGVASRQGDTGAAYQPEAGGWIALGWADYRPEWCAAQLNAWFLTQGDADKVLQNPRFVVPTNLFALWELYEKTHDRPLLRRFYPFARRRYREMQAAGKDYANQTEVLAYLIRSAQVLRAMAVELGQPLAECDRYTQDAADASRTLAALMQAAASMPPTNLATDLLPLIAGTGLLPAAPYQTLLARLVEPAAYASPFGLRDTPHGKISFGTNWLLWKALLDAGETKSAYQVAKKVTAAYNKAQITANACPEWLDGDTGAAGGRTDFTGDACTLLPMYRAYHTLGTASAGWDILLVSQYYDAKTDTLRVGFRPQNTNGKAVFIAVMGKPNGTYKLSGTFSGTAKADASGFVTIAAPADLTTQSIEIKFAAPPDKP